MASSFANILSQVLAEVHAGVEAVAPAELEEFVQRLSNAKSVFVTGQGRTGLVARAFAMRLMHLGKRAFVVAETICPPVAPGDLLFACSGSGETMITCSYAERAHRLGALVVAATGRLGSRLNQIADLTLYLPTPPSSQLGNARFEQCLWLILDAVAVAYAERHRIPFDSIWERHANLE